MNRTIWLIAEDAFDTQVFAQILRSKGINVQVQPIRLPGGAGGISRLVKALPSLIRTANAKRRKGDCIAVLHDLDTFVADRQDAQYDAVDRICREHGAVHLVADDEVEAWMLADTGLCSFLGIKPQNRDGQPNVKEIIESHLRKKKMVYQATQRDKLIMKMDGSGDRFSPSMKQAINRLRQDRCIPAASR